MEGSFLLIQFLQAMGKFENFLCRNIFNELILSAISGGCKSKKPFPSRKHIGSIDDPLMLSSITSMMHQFYIEHRKQWWIFDVTSTFHPCFQCFSTLKATISHLIGINDSSMKYRWIINRTMMNHRWRNSCVYVFYGIQRNKITNSLYEIII